MSRGTFTKILYEGKGGGKPIVYPCEDPATVVAIGLSAGEVITLEYTDQIHPVSEKPGFSEGFIDFDHPYLTQVKLNLNPQEPRQSNIYFDSTGWAFQFKDRKFISPGVHPVVPVIYAPTKGGEVTITYEVLDDLATGEPSEFIWGMKYVDPNNFIGWRVNDDAYEVVLFENGSLSIVYTGGPVGIGDLMEFKFNNTNAILTVNSTELYNHTLTGNLTHNGFFGLLQYGTFGGVKDNNFMKITSITPQENRWHTIPDQELSVDAPLLSIYSPLLFRLNIPATSKTVSVHLIKSN